MVGMGSRLLLLWCVMNNKKQINDLAKRINYIVSDIPLSTMADTDKVYALLLAIKAVPYDKKWEQAWESFIEDAFDEVMYK